MMFTQRYLTRFTQIKNGINNAWSRSRMQYHLPPLLEQLASLLESGLPMKQSLQHLQAMPIHHMPRAYILELLAALESGQSLSSVWPSRLPPLYDILCQTGENTGSLPTVMLAWSSYARAQRAWFMKMVRLCMYPCLLVTMSTLLIGFLMHTVLPTFLSMYSQLGLQTPTSTREVLAGVQVLKKTAIAVFWGGIVIALGLWVVHRKCTSLWEVVRRYVPGSRLMQLHQTRILCLLLSLFLDAGIPVGDSLHHLASTRGPRWMAQSIPDIEARVLRGEVLYRAFGGNWDPLLYILLRWAEQTGDLVQALQKVEQHAQEALWRRVQGVVKALEPTLVIAMGACVAMTMLAVFVPMYDLMSQVSNATH